MEDPVKRLHQSRNRIAHHEGIWHLPLEARRDGIQTVLGFMSPVAATWVADASRIDDVLAHRPGRSALTQETWSGAPPGIG